MLPARCQAEGHVSISPRVLAEASGKADGKPTGTPTRPVVGVPANARHALSDLILIFTNRKFVNLEEHIPLVAPTPFRENKDAEGDSNRR